MYIYFCDTEFRYKFFSQVYEGVLIVIDNMVRWISVPRYDAFRPPVRCIVDLWEGFDAYICPERWGASQTMSKKPRSLSPK